MGVVWSSPHLIVWSLHILNFGCLDHQERFCAQYLSFPRMGHRHDDSSSHSTEAGRVLGAASICWLRGRTIIDKWVSRLFLFLNEATYIYYSMKLLCTEMPYLVLWCLQCRVTWRSQPNCRASLQTVAHWCTQCFPCHVFQCHTLGLWQVFKRNSTCLFRWWSDLRLSQKA